MVAVAGGREILCAEYATFGSPALARQYCLCLQAGAPVLLDDAEMRVDIEKFKTYGKTPRPRGPEPGG